MQQILVNLIALIAVLFLARMIYRGFTASRRNKQAVCNGCGTCDSAQSKTANLGGTVLPPARPHMSDLTK